MVVVDVAKTGHDHLVADVYPSGAGPASAVTSVSAPTADTFPAVTANASAHGALRSTV